MTSYTSLVSLQVLCCIDDTLCDVIGDNLFWPLSYSKAEYSTLMTLHHHFQERKCLKGDFSIMLDDIQENIGNALLVVTSN